MMSPISLFMSGCYQDKILSDDSDFITIEYFGQRKGGRDYLIQNDAFFFIKENKKYILPVNHVMAHITPLTEKKIVVERHLISPEEYSRKNNDIHSRISFVGAYNKTKQLAEKHSKCPFHR